MDTPDNYYATLGVPFDADEDMIKRAYRQLARRFHPDLAGPESAVQMKRINRAYAVLGDPEQRLKYDTLLGGTIDLRQSGLSRPRQRAHRVDPADELEFAGLSIFSTRGPLHTGASIRAGLGIISTLTSNTTESGLVIAAGTTDGKGLIWHSAQKVTNSTFASDPARTIESLRELRFSASGSLLAGWGRLGIHIWDAQTGNLRWSYPLTQRSVFDHYTLSVVLQDDPTGERVHLALPYLPEDPRAPQKVGVRATDVTQYTLDAETTQGESLLCPEEELETRQFWAIRLRALASDARSLLTLSCAHTPGSSDEMIIIRHWDLTTRSRFGNRPRPRISTSILAGLCADCTPPYAMTPDTYTLAFVSMRQKIRVQNTRTGAYNELPSGMMGGSSRLAISKDASFLAVAREDSEASEGVIDLWSLQENKVVQRLYHPWQISALHFAGRQQLVVALTDGTIQIWE